MSDGASGLAEERVKEKENGKCKLLRHSPDVWFHSLGGRDEGERYICLFVKKRDSVLCFKGRKDDEKISKQ